MTLRTQGFYSSQKWLAAWLADSVAELPNTAGATRQTKALNANDLGNVQGVPYICEDPTLDAAVWTRVEDVENPINPPAALPPPLMLASAVVLGNGTVYPGSLITWNDLDIVIGDDSGHVANSGAYANPLTGSDLPSFVYTTTIPLIGALGSGNYNAGTVSSYFVDTSGTPADPGVFVIQVFGK